MQGGGELVQGLHQLPEFQRGSVEGMLQSKGDCSKLFLSLREAGGGGFHELGD